MITVDGIGERPLFMSKPDVSIKVPTPGSEGTIDDSLDCILTGNGRIVQFEERLTNRSPPIHSYETLRFGNVGYTANTPVIGNVDMVWIPGELTYDDAGNQVKKGSWVGITHGQGLPKGPFKLGEEHAKLIAEAYGSSVPLDEVLNTPPSKLYIPRHNSHLEIALGPRNPVSVCMEILEWDTDLFLKGGNREVVLEQVTEELNDDQLKKADEQLAYLKMAICHYLGDKRTDKAIHTLVGKLNDETNVKGYSVGACAADSLHMMGFADTVEGVWDKIINPDENGKARGYTGLNILKNEPEQGAVLPELVEVNCYLRLAEKSKTNKLRYQELIGKFKEITRVIQKKEDMYASFSALLEQYCSETRHDDVKRRNNLTKVYDALKENVHDDKDMGITRRIGNVSTGLPLSYKLKVKDKVIVTAEITEQTKGPVLNVYVGTK